MVKKIRLVLLIVFISVTFSGCSENVSGSSRIDKGTLDLRGFDISKNTIRLDGLWEFYWNKFVDYDKLDKVRPDIYADIPDEWNKYLVNGRKLPGKGYATYRLHVVSNLPEGTMFGMLLNTFSSAYKLYIDADMIASNGTPADNAGDEVGELKPMAVFFPLPASEFDIIIQVSNFEYARGGFWNKVSIGSAERILNLNDNAVGKELLTIGAVFIIAVYFLVIYLFEREFKFSLYFSCFCFLLILSIDAVDQFLICRIFDAISYNAAVFIWYLATIWVVYFLIMTVHELYKSVFSKIVSRVTLILIIIYQIIILFTKPVIYSAIGSVSNIIGLFCVLCTIIIIIIGIKNGIKDAWLNLACLVILLITFIHDYLIWTNRIKSSEILYYSIFLCLSLQIIMQTGKIKEFINKSVSNELAYLQAQIKPHFLYNTINTFISLTYYNVEQARGLLRNFAEYLRRSFDFKEMNQYVPLQNEIELARAYSEIEKVRFEDKLTISFSIPDNIEYNVPILILQPILENAIIHGVLPKSEGGHIDVTIREEDKQLVFTVKDDGVGMSHADNDKLPEGRTGSRVGLNNIAKRLKRLYGRGLIIKSSPGAGTEITWSVPIKGRRRIK